MIFEFTLVAPRLLGWTLARRKRRILTLSDFWKCPHYGFGQEKMPARKVFSEARYATFPGSAYDVLCPQVGGWVDGQALL